MRIERDICYDELNRKNLCDIYFQENTISKPVVLIVHGGFWSLGCKEEMQEIACFLAQNYVCVAVEYTLSNFDNDLFQKIVVSELLTFLILMLVISSSPLKVGLLFAAFFLSVYAIVKMALVCTMEEKTHPVHVQDIAKSIKFVYNSIDKYGGDKNRIFLLGHSSGAHLVSLVTVNPRFLNSLNISPKIIRGVISISGPYSYWRMQESSVKYITNRSVFGDLSTNLTPAHLNNIEPAQYDTWAKIIDAWPIFHEYAINEQTPPFLLLTAGIDLSLLYHARDFADVLKRNNAHVQVVHFDSTNHFSIRTKWMDKNKEVGSIVQSFIKTIEENSL